MHALFFPPPLPRQWKQITLPVIQNLFPNFQGHKKVILVFFLPLILFLSLSAQLLLLNKSPKNVEGVGLFFFFLHAQNWCKVCIYGCVRVCTCVIFFFCARNVFNYRKLIKKKYYCMARKLFSIFRVIFGVKIGWDRHVFPYWAQAAIP